MKKRIFVALDISEEARRRAANLISALRSRFPEVRAGWDKPEKLHLTIKFLGETDDFEIKKITENLRNLRFEPFEIRFTNAGCFPNLSSPRVIWLGFDKQCTDKLNNLYNIISKLLNGINGSENKS